MLLLLCTVQKQYVCAQTRCELQVYSDWTEAITSMADTADVSVRQLLLQLCCSMQFTLALSGSRHQAWLRNKRQYSSSGSNSSTIDEDIAIQLQ
jgi:hypothetical protein